MIVVLCPPPASKMIIVSKCEFYTAPSAVARARCSVLFRIRAPKCAKSTQRLFDPATLRYRTAAGGAPGR